MIHGVVGLIKLGEGLKLKPYQCPANRTTIGYGRNLDDLGISEHEAEYLLQNDIARVSSELSGRGLLDGLNDVRSAVVIDMCFNVGINRLLRFRNMVAALRVHDYDRAAAEMVDSAWYGQVGERSKRLVKMMRSGEWPK